MAKPHQPEGRGTDKIIAESRPWARRRGVSGADKNVYSTLGSALPPPAPVIAQSAGSHRQTFLSAVANDRTMPRPHQPGRRDQVSTSECASPYTSPRSSAIQ